MKVLLFAPFARWSPHQETDLEIAENHILAGDEVTWISCDRDLAGCEPNPDHVELECTKCVGRKHTGLRLLSGKVEVLRRSRLVSAADRARAASLPTRFDSNEALRELRLDEFDLGYAVLSSLVWCDKDVRVDLGQESTRLPRFMRSAAETFLAMKRFLAERDFDRVYVFNGRMSVMRAVLRAAQVTGTDVWVHERGSDLSKYGLFHGAMPHEIHAHTARVRARWAAPEPPLEEKVRVAEAWFERRAQGVIGNWSSYTDAQQSGALPAEWDPARRNVSLFTSTEYEFAAIGDDWKSPLFDDQTEGVITIAQALSAAGQVHLTIRMHPNPTGSQSSSATRLRALDVPGVTVVPPESKVCTYALMHASEKVVVQSSTMGVEATFWGKPSIQAGRSMYSELGAVHQPQTFEELIEAIHDPDLPPAERDGALQYGYDQAVFGEPFEHFTPEHLFAGRFKGKKIKPRGPYRMRIKWHDVRSRAGARVRGWLGRD